MRIWIDLANSPHVPFFRPLANEFMRRGHEVIVTARQFAETVPLAEAAGFAAQVIGGHGGAKLYRQSRQPGRTRIGTRALGARKTNRPGRKSQLVFANSGGARAIDAIGNADGLRTSARKSSRLPSRFACDRSARISRSSVDAFRRCACESETI